MVTESGVALVLIGELEGLSDAHLVGCALEEAGIAYRVAEHQSHGFDVAIPHGWGMLYAEEGRTEDVRAILEEVRDDERMVDNEDDDEAGEEE